MTGYIYILRIFWSARVHTLQANFDISNSKGMGKTLNFDISNSKGMGKTLEFSEVRDSKL